MVVAVVAVLVVVVVAVVEVVLRRLALRLLPRPPPLSLPAKSRA